MDEKYWKVFEEAMEKEQAVLVEFADSSKVVCWIEKIDEEYDNIRKVRFSRLGYFPLEAIEKARIISTPDLVEALEKFRKIMDSMGKIDNVYLYP